MRKIGKIFLYIAIALYVLLVLRCVGIGYTPVTHLTPEELLWVKGMGTKTYGIFKSDSGRVIRMKLEYRDVDNYKDPFTPFMSNIGNSEASATYLFSLSDKKTEINGSFVIKKKHGSDKPVFKYRFGNVRAPEDEMWLNAKIFNLQGREIPNCLIIDSTLLSPATYYVDLTFKPTADRLVISRDYGPIYFRLGNGEEFFRQFK